MKQITLFPAPRVADLIPLAPSVSDAAGTLNRSQAEWIAAAKLRAKAAAERASAQTKSIKPYSETPMHLADEDRRYDLNQTCPMCLTYISLERTFTANGKPPRYRLCCLNELCAWNTPWCDTSQQALNCYKVVKALLHGSP